MPGPKRPRADHQEESVPVNLTELSLLVQIATPGPLSAVLEAVRQMMEADKPRGQQAIACLIARRLNPAIELTLEQEAAVRGMDVKTQRAKIQAKEPLRPIV